MKYKTLFRLGLKLVGVTIVAISTNQLFWAIGFFLESRSSNPTMLLSGIDSQLVGSILQLGVGLYLFFGGRWIVNLAIPSNRPYCPECAYDLTGAVEPRCPECGTPFRWEDVQPKTEDRSGKAE